MRRLLPSGATSIGCAVLATSDSHSVLLIYAIGTGIGFGLTALSCTVLMMNYFGQRHNLELFSSMCLVGAASALAGLQLSLWQDTPAGPSIVSAAASRPTRRASVQAAR